MHSQFLISFRKDSVDDKTLSCIAAIMIVVFFVPYTASGFAACGKLFSSLIWCQTIFPQWL